MPQLDPQARTLLEAMPPLPEFKSANLAALREAMAVPPLAGEPEAVERIEELRVPGPAGEIPVRVYWPGGAGPFPVLVFFHGGGFVFCNVDSHDGVCRSLANGAGCVVVSVDYRLAPEHPYPAAPEDCYAATEWVAAHADELDIDPARMAVGGDSAGGNLAAVVALMARDKGGPTLRYQLLVYPVTNRNFKTGSYKENADGYFLTSAMMQWFWQQYAPAEERAAEPYASPMRAKDVSGLPAGLCITAGFDPLRDEGEAYAAKLRAAGVELQIQRYDGMFHGFFSMTTLLDVAREAMSDACTALRRGLEA